MSCIDVVDRKAVRLPRVVLRLGREDAVIIADNRPVPYEIRSGERLALPADGGEFFFQLLPQAVGSDGLKVPECFPIGTHPALEFEQGRFAQPMQGTVKDSWRDASLCIDRIGRAVDGRASDDVPGKGLCLPHHLRSRPYAHRPGYQVNLSVTCQCLNVEVEPTVVVANHQVTILRTVVKKGRFVHPPSGKEEDEARAMLVYDKGLVHIYLIIPSYSVRGTSLIGLFHSVSLPETLCFTV